jgi:hypothetical protein
MSDELKERHILTLILIVRFACATLDVGHPIHDVQGIVIMQTSEKFALFIADPAVQRTLASALDIIPYSVCSSLELFRISPTG